MRHEEVQEVTLYGDYISDQGEIARRWAFSGLGVVNKTAIDVVEDIRTGHLVQVLPQ